MCFLDNVLSQKEEIFSDVVEDFCQVFSVLIRFREWVYHFSTSYKQAYMQLCLPKLLAPYISLHLLFWNPFDPEENVSLMEMPWFQRLLFYEYKNEASDNLLIPRLIEMIIIPKLTGMYITCTVQIKRP